MPYHLDNAFLREDPWIAIIGVGGTGGFVAESLCRLLTGRKATVTLVDHDRVEPHNLLRQNFGPADVGRFKSEALAERLSKQFDRVIGYSTQPLAIPEISYYGNQTPGLPRYGNYLMIGCTDNAAARNAMNEILPDSTHAWLIDSGNDTDWGQILIGNVSSLRFSEKEAFRDDTCYYLPAPLLQRPDLMTAVSTAPPDVDCAAALDLTDQDPTINQFMAAMITSVVRKMFAGTCPFMSLYLDLGAGTMTPTYATPENVRRALERNAEAHMLDAYDGDPPPGDDWD